MSAHGSTPGQVMSQSRLASRFHQILMSAPGLEATEDLDLDLATKDLDLDLDIALIVLDAETDSLYSFC